MGEDYARAEGRGYADATEWRRAHEDFFRSEGIAEFLGDTSVIDDAQGLRVRGALLGGPQHGHRRVTAAGGDLGPAEGRSLYPDSVNVA